MVKAPDLAPEHKRRILEDLVREVALDLSGDFEIITNLGDPLRGKVEARQRARGVKGRELDGLC